MIVARAPLRISFVGGGTDLPDFYRYHQGSVISAAIDKFVYVVVNPTPMIPKVSARYSISETVDHPSELQHTRIRAALLDLGIKKGIEVGSYASVVAKTGLGSSSTFSVALIKALYDYLGKNLSREEAAKEACRLEIELVGEPIGKQDQYAAAYGGMNIFRFNPDDSVETEPVLLDYQKQARLENNLMLFFTGITRFASEVLEEQKANTVKNKNIEALRKAAALVPAFHKHLLDGDIKGMGDLLHQNWLLKKSFASGISSTVLDELYETGRTAGAFGGKVLGAGGGGCLLLLVELAKRQQVLAALHETAKNYGLSEAREIPVRFVQAGVEILFRSND